MPCRGNDKNDNDNDYDNADDNDNNNNNLRVLGSPNPAQSLLRREVLSGPLAELASGG